MGFMILNDCIGYKYIVFLDHPSKDKGREKEGIGKKRQSKIGLPKTAVRKRMDARMNCTLIYNNIK